MKIVLGALALAATMLAVPAQAATLLTDVTDYNAFVLGDYKADYGYGDVEGRVAVGGSARFAGFGVAQVGSVDLGDTYTLVVNGALSYTNGQIFQGSALVGGTVTTSQLGTPDGAIVQQNPTGLNVTAEGVRLKALSDALAGLAVNGGFTRKFGNLGFVGGETGLNVFTIDAADFTEQNIAITAPVGSKVLVNVVGATTGINGHGFSLTGVARGDVLFNFAGTTSLTLSGIGWQGSILAPNAHLAFTNGQINGLVVAGSIDGPGQINYAPYTGGLLTPSAVPEPAGWALLIGGLGLTGAALRRRAPRLRIA